MSLPFYVPISAKVLINDESTGNLKYYAGLFRFAFSSIGCSPRKREANLHLSISFSKCCFSMRLEAKNIETIIAAHPEPTTTELNSVPPAFNTLRAAAM